MVVLTYIFVEKEGYKVKNKKRKRVNTPFKYKNPEAICFGVYFFELIYFIDLITQCRQVNKSITINSTTKIIIKKPTGFPRNIPFTSFIIPKMKIEIMK